MTHNAISFIAMSRDGLTESEIIELLQVPAADWFRLYLALKPYLISRCGALSFAHSSLQNAAANLCSINDREKVKIREKLIEYFMVKKHSHRSIYLLPWLMKETGAYEALFSFLSDEYCFMDLTKTPEELKIYWSETEEATHKTKTIGYKKLIESPEQFPVETIIELARFFAETDSPKEAKKLLVNIISRNSYKVSEVERLSAFGLLGNLAHASGNYCEALEYYRKQIFICEKNKNDMELARTYGNIGLCHKADKCYPEAIDAFKKAQNIFEKIGYFRGVQIALGNQGSVYFDMGDSEYAERLYKAQEQMAAEIGSVAGQASALGGQAAICVLDKQFAEADELLKQQESLCRRISDFWQLSTALGNRAVLLFEQKEYNKAIRSFREKYSICRRLNSASGIENALANLVKVFRQTGNDSEALMYCEKRISFCRKKRLVSQLAEALLEKSSFDFISKGEADFAKAEAQAIIKAHGLNICSEQFKKGGVS
jgi:tetratricopeptide (TPR) repeat protein